MNMQPPDGRSDPAVIRVAAVALGFSVIAVVIGLCVSAAVSATIPNQLWLFGNTLAGALLGLLIPSPAQKEKPTVAAPNPAKTVAVEIWHNRVFLALLFIFVFSAIYSDATGSKELLSVAGAAGGALLGLLAPSPVATQA